MKSIEKYLKNSKCRISQKPKPKSEQLREQIGFILQIYLWPLKFTKIGAELRIFLKTSPCLPWVIGIKYDLSQAMCGSPNRILHM